MASKFTIKQDAKSEPLPECIFTIGYGGGSYIKIHTSVPVTSNLTVFVDYRYSPMHGEEVEGSTVMTVIKGTSNVEFSVKESPDDEPQVVFAQANNWTPLSDGYLRYVYGN